jgi:hypothetical protein
MTPSKAPFPFSGTWKLTKCESSQPDLPHPVSGITTFTPKEDGVHYTNEGVWSDGRSAKVTAVLQLDGTWCPLTGSLVSDSVSFSRLEDGSFEVKMRKGGSDVGTNRSAASADGRTMTGHWEFAGPGGTTITWKTTSERQ